MLQAYLEAQTIIAKAGGRQATGNDATINGTRVRAPTSVGPDELTNIYRDLERDNPNSDARDLALKTRDKVAHKGKYLRRGANLDGYGSHGSSSPESSRLYLNNMRDNVTFSRKGRVSKVGKPGIFGAK